MSTATTIKLPRFRGPMLDFLRNHDHELMLCGGADMGKTWASCVKSFMLCADKNRKGVHGCMVRKTFNSIQESGARTFNTITAGTGLRRYGGTQHTEKWVFPNGSELVCVGLDNPDKLLSSEWDFVQVIQSEQLSLSDWESIAHRCTGRGAVVAWPQVFGDCNPGGSRHWIRERAKAGKLTMLSATHKDNPALYDDNGNILPEGKKRIGILESTLTGIRRKRLLEGIWATAEGAVFDTFDASVHVTTRNPAEMVKWHLCEDEGYTNPAAILLIGEDTDGRWHIFQEFYQSGILPSRIVTLSKEWYDRNQVKRIAVDAAAAGLIADLLAAGMNAVGGKGRIIDGINAIQNRLKVQGDNRPRLTIDPSCVCTINEFESHIWSANKSDGTPRPKDTPLDKDNHSIAAIRYLHDVEATPDGSFASADGFRVGGTESNIFTPDRLEMDSLGDF